MLLITGITGLTGRFLYEELLDKKKKFKCLVRKSSGIKSLRDYKNVEFVYGDVANEKDIINALEGVNEVIHMVNIRYSSQIIKACKFCGVKRVVFVSTTGIYSKYRNCSSLYKKLEEEIFNSGLDYTIIRPTMIYGNEQDKNIHKLVKIVNKYPIFPIPGKGENLVQPIHAKDLASVIVKACCEKRSIKQAYNVAGKEPITFKNLIYQIANALNKKIKIVHIPYKVALVAGKIGDIIPNSLIKYERVLRLLEDKNFDYRKAKEELGFSPMSFEEGIKLEIEALRKSGVI